MNRSSYFFPILTTMLLLAGSGWWSGRLAIRDQTQLQAQRATADRWERQIRQSRAQRDELLRRIDTARNQLAASVSADPSLPPPDPAQATEVERWVRQVKKLKQAFAQRPDQAIPELGVLDDRDWLRIARRVKLDTDDNLQRAFALVRNEAKFRFVQWMVNALQAHLKTTHGELPSDTAELGPYFDPPPDPAMLAQYEMVRSGAFSEAPKGPVLKERSVVNEDYDKRFTIDRQDDYAPSYNYALKHDPEAPPDELMLADEMKRDADNAVRAFVAAHHGALPASPEQLLPYFNPPLGPLMTERLSRTLSPEEQKQFQEEIAPIAGSRP